MDNPKLTAEQVHAIMRDVLFSADEVVDDKPPENIIVVEGLVRNFGFHPERIKESKPKIDALLMQLPRQFHKATGGGWTFLNGCWDKDGIQWGEQRDVEELVCLGIAVRSASWILRDMANVMPGGVPYFVIDIAAQNPTERT